MSIMNSKTILFFLSALFSACQSYTEKLLLVTEQPVLPVLTMKEINPVLKIEVIRENPTDYSVQDICLSLQGTTDINDIEQICLYEADKTGMLNPKSSICKPVPALEKVVLKTNLPVSTDTVSLWVSLKLKDRVDLSHRVDVSCQEITTSLGKVAVAAGATTSPLRVGVAVHQHMQNNVHTARIPGLATSKKGTLLAIYDARYESSRDLQGHMDIGLNRSTDGGETWQPMQVAMDMKEWGGLPEKYNGVSDANILIDDQTGDIYIAGLWMHGVLDGNTGKWIEGLTQDSTRWMHQWRARGSQPGVGVKETSQCLITKSTDDGLTWSEPVNITSQTKRKEWWLYAPAPGHGITLEDGTLLIPTQGRDKEGLPFSNITYSKDGGKTWITSNPAYSNVTECMAVQLPDGSIMLNMRDNRNHGNKEENGRRICTTSDLGQTWTEHPTSRKALIESTCMASIHKHVYQQDGEEKTLLLFANPESYSERNHLTLKVSFDNGNTWPAEKKILLDEYDSYGYSCITSVDDNTIGILYESSQADMVFQQVKLNELLN